MITIRNVMHDLKAELPSEIPTQAGVNSALDSRPFVCRVNGRAAMTDIFNKIGLKPDDEVCVTNSSGQTYISACVTCTVFNHCKPSRVLSDKTKAIFIIHEYGVPHPDLEKLVEWGKENGAYVIEDCAHTFDSTIGNVPVGSFGDYAIFSLPKLLPQSMGGLLVMREPDEFPPTQPDCIAVEKEFKTYIPYLHWLSQERRKTYSYLESAFSQFETLFKLTPEITPFFIGFLVENAAKIRQSTPNIDWGTSMDPNILLIPTNPLVKREKIVQAVREAIGDSAKGARYGA